VIRENRMTIFNPAFITALAALPSSLASWIWARRRQWSKYGQS
jgi:hypothetical protein